MKKALKRFVDIWKLDFLAKFFAGECKNNKTTISFWILSSLALSLMVAVGFCVFLCDSYDDTVALLERDIPESAQITITDGQLTTQNIDEPFFREINAHSDDNSYDGSFVIIIDTRSDAYDLTSLDEYNGGIIVLGDRAYFKDGTEFDQIVFSEIPNFTVSKDDILEFVSKYFIFPFSIILTILLGVFMFFWFSVFRLVSAFWWALMLFVLTKIFDIECKYMTAYKAVINLYFIPTVVVFMVGFLGLNIPLMTTIIFIAIFIANLLWIKKHPQVEETENVLKTIPEIKKVKIVKQSKKK
ncbi:MAG: DUF1189 family protein [Candidatus Moraniibacteriota bacterium]|jgi:uncharacterized membrane protein